MWKLTLKTTPTDRERRKTLDDGLDAAGRGIEASRQKQMDELLSCDPLLARRKILKRRYNPPASGIDSYDPNETVN